MSLRPPNFELPFCLLTDASDEGWGAALCQYDEAPCAHEGCEVVTSSMPVGKGSRRFFCCDEHHKASALKFTKHDLEHKHRNVIAWFSKAYPESVRSAPVFYREAFAALTGLEKIKIFALSSKHPVHLFTDHNPLLWVRSTDKGAVSSFLIERLADVDFKSITAKELPRRMHCQTRFQDAPASPQQNSRRTDYSKLFAQS